MPRHDPIHSDPREMGAEAFMRPGVFRADDICPFTHDLVARSQYLAGWQAEARDFRDVRRLYVHGGARG